MKKLFFLIATIASVHLSATALAIEIEASLVESGDVARARRLATRDRVGEVAPATVTKRRVATANRSSPPWRPIVCLPSRFLRPSWPEPIGERFKAFECNWGNGFFSLGLSFCFGEEALTEFAKAKVVKIVATRDSPCIVTTTENPSQETMSLSVNTSDKLAPINQSVLSAVTEAFFAKFPAAVWEDGADLGSKQERYLKDLGFDLIHEYVTDGGIPGGVFFRSSNETLENQEFIYFTYSGRRVRLASLLEESDVRPSPAPPLPLGLGSEVGLVSLSESDSGDDLARKGGKSPQVGCPPALRGDLPLTRPSGALTSLGNPRVTPSVSLHPGIASYSGQLYLM